MTGDEFRVRRYAARLTGQAVADQAGLSRVTVYHFESGQSVRPDTARRLGLALAELVEAGDSRSKRAPSDVVARAVREVEEYGVTQTDAAERHGIHQSTISRHVASKARGSRPPRFHMARTIEEDAS